MNKFGGWDVAVPRDALPQRIATAMGGLNKLLGCRYAFVAYLGTQRVNGVNHAVLAQQRVLTGEDAVNAVVLVFNETQDSLDVALTDVRRVVEAGGPLGGVKVEMSTEIPLKARSALSAALAGFTGSKVTPFAYIGAQIVKGVDYVLAAEVTPVVPNAVPDLALVTVCADGHLEFERLFEVGDADLANKAALGYAFTWLK